MERPTPHVVADTNLHNLQLAYQRRAQLADVAMTGMLAQMVTLTHDMKMAIVREAIKYANAEHDRRVAMARCEAAKERAGQE